MWTKLILLCIFGFSGSLTTSFDMRGIINGDRMASVPLGVSLGRGQLDVEGICRTPGMACQNCSLAVTCVPLPMGWLKLPLQECKNGLTCNAHLGQCSDQPVPECAPRSQEHKHSCEQVGIFPDAFDCRKFHLCSPPDGLPDGKPADHRTALCPRHYGYNPQTAQCSVELANGQCSENVTPECTRVGQYDVLPSSGNHYYVCIEKDGVLHPQIFICPNGWFFWQGYCRPPPRSQPEVEPQNPGPQPGSDPTGTDAKSTESHDQSTEEVETTPKLQVETTTKLQEEATKVRSPDAVTTSTENPMSFFSTDAASTYPTDTFLADKFDLSNYESTDDVHDAPVNNDFVNSYENNEW